MPDPLSIEEIRRAADRIATEAIRTPVLSSNELDRRTGARVFCKAESSQRAGAFKFRGAFNRIVQIPEDQRPNGVVAVSSGNHGSAVACVGSILGIPTTVFIPEDTPLAKRKLMEEFGARLETVDRNDPDRDRPALALVEQTGATFVHPFEDREVMAGQGTAGLELWEEVGDLDVLITPMSGGGLMAGCASALSHLSPGCVFVGAEPERADDTRRSLERGEIVHLDPVSTIADGLAVLQPGENTFAINRTLVSEVITIAEEAFIEAMGFALEELGEVVEPSGTAALAALLGSGQRWSGKTVGIVLSGGNVDKEKFPQIFG